MSVWNIFTYFTFPLPSWPKLKYFDKKKMWNIWRKVGMCSVSLSAGNKNDDDNSDDDNGHLARFSNEKPQLLFFLDQGFVCRSFADSHWYVRWSLWEFEIVRWSCMRIWDCQKCQIRMWANDQITIIRRSDHNLRLSDFQIRMWESKCRFCWWVWWAIQSQWRAKPW